MDYGSSVSLAGGLFQLVFFDSHRYQLRYAFFRHRDAMEGVGGCHSNFVMCDDDELSGLGELFQNSHEAADISVIKRGVYFVEDAKGTGFD